MSHAVAHMDEMTQQNAALAEQSAASATSLSSQIKSLNELVAEFRVSGQNASYAGSPRAPSAAVGPRLHDAAYGAGIGPRTCHVPGQIAL